MPELQPPTRIERGSNPELSSQQLYIQDLWLHVDTIPNLSEQSQYLYSSEAETEFLGAYCEAHSSQNYLKDKEIVPLQRKDIIDPDFCKYVSNLTRHVTGNSPDRHWYSTKGNEYSHQAKTHQAMYASRQWERFYVEYMREKRVFHAGFMTAVLNGEPINELLSNIGLRDGAPVDMPSTSLNSGEKEPAAPSLYDKTNWLAASTLSALALPPEMCSAAMKRRVIELWSEHADLSNPESIKSFYGLEKRTDAVRLPWSMRSNLDLQASQHPQWRQNRHIKHYLGEVVSPRADGATALLQERPKDYVQVMLLGVFGQLGNLPNALRALQDIGKFKDEIKDIIFADDASFNTIYYDADSSSFEPPKSLVDLLGDGMETVTQEEIIHGLRLRVQVLEDKLAEEQGRAAHNAEAAEGWQKSYYDLYNAVTQANRLNPAEELMAQYGIHPSVNDDNLKVLVRSLLSNFGRQLHPDVNPDPKADTQFRKISDDLRRILEYRGL